jgi:hypothetical protein
VIRVRFNVSEELITSIIRWKGVKVLGTTLLVTSNVPYSLIFYTDDGGDTLLQSVGSRKSHTASHLRRLSYSSNKFGIEVFDV